MRPPHTSLSAARLSGNSSVSSDLRFRLDILVTLVEAYEAKQYPMVGPDPLAAILHRMEALRMTRKDLEPLLGTRRRVSEVLARKRPLSLAMIRKIAKAMRIPADVLIQPYDTETSRAAS